MPTILVKPVKQELWLEFSSMFVTSGLKFFEKSFNLLTLSPRSTCGQFNSTLRSACVAQELGIIYKIQTNMEVI